MLYFGERRWSGAFAAGLSPVVIGAAAAFRILSKQDPSTAALESFRVRLARGSSRIREPALCMRVLLERLRGEDAFETSGTFRSAQN